MSDYISREALFQEIQDSKFSVESDGKENEIANLAIRCFWDVCLSRIRNFPAADVREVVLCRECKYWNVRYNKAHKGHFCEVTTQFVQESDYCSFGERCADMRGEADGN